MNISYKAGLLTATIGKGFGRLTGGVIANFTRGLTGRGQDVEIIEIPEDENNPNAVFSEADEKFIRENKLHRLGTDDELEEPMIEFVDDDYGVMLFSASQIMTMYRELHPRTDEQGES